MVSIKALNWQPKKAPHLENSRVRAWAGWQAGRVWQAGGACWTPAGLGREPPTCTTCTEEENDGEDDDEDDGEEEEEEEEEEKPAVQLQHT